MPVESEQRTRPNRQQALRLLRAVRLVWESGPGWTAATVVLTFIQGILPLISLYLIKLVVDTVAAGLSDANRTDVLGRALLYILLEGVVTLVGAIARSLAGMVSEGQSMLVTDRVQQTIHAKSVEADLEYYENAQYYDTLHRAQQEAGFRPTRIFNGMVQAAQNAISLAALAGLLFSLHWLIPLVLLATAAPGVLARMRYSSSLYQWQRGQTGRERLAWYLSWMLTRDSHAKEVRLFDLGGLFSRRYLDLRRLLRSERLALARRRTLIETGAQLAATLGVFGALAFIAYRALHGVGTIGDLVMYYQAFQRGQAFLRDMLGSVASLYEDSLFLSNLYEFLDLKKTVVEPARALPVPRPMRSGVAFEHVTFCYPQSTRKVLDDINLTVRPGEVVALVGENGSGKTTLCKLLCRLYDPVAGSITLDGADLRSFNTAELRREISVIFQDYARYNMSARENIWLGNVALAADDARIQAAARESGADDVISRLPRGYDTTLGKWFEEGEELSIGEWQKVALARAFVRDAQIVVLDEPTSAMDARTEFEVFSHFRRLVAGRAAILISHRFSTVRMADTIYVLDGGRIIERGSHDELMRLGGAYARLFEIQAQNYR